MKTYAFCIHALLILILSAACTKKSESQLFAGAVALDTATIASGLDTPWEILWGPDNHIWFTERKGTVSRLNPASGEHSVILTIPDVFETGESGLLGMVLHPGFAENPFVYLVYNYTDGPLIKERLVRYSWNGSTLDDPLILLNGIGANSYHDGSRLAFGPDGKIYMSTGDAGNPSDSQNPGSLNGKILRINPDGSVPDGNPFPGSYVWSLGHRNSQGLVFAPTGILYESEHGPSTDDEFNIIEPGRNYGWPDVEGYCNLPAEMTFCSDNMVKEPLLAWTPTLAVAGIGYYNHAEIPEWQNSILLTTLKAGELLVLKLSPDGLAVTEQNIFFTGIFGRLRDVCIAPDGRVFLAVSNRDGRGNPRPADDRIVEITAAGSTGISGAGSGGDTLHLFPNPGSSQTHVWISQHLNADSFQVFNQTGQPVLSGPVTSAEFTLETGGLPAGCYLIRVLGRNGALTARFLVNR